MLFRNEVSAHGCSGRRGRLEECSWAGAVCAKGPWLRTASGQDGQVDTARALSGLQTERGRPVPKSPTGGARCGCFWE